MIVYSTSVAICRGIPHSSGGEHILPFFQTKSESNKSAKNTRSAQYSINGKTRPLTADVFETQI